MIDDYVVMEVVRGSDDSAPMSELGFVANLTAFESRNVEVDMVFEHPLSLSIGSNGPDLLRVSFRDTSLFIDAETGLSFDQNTAFILTIPKQIPKQQARTLQVVLKVV